MRDLAVFEQFRNRKLEIKAYGSQAVFRAHEHIAGVFDVPSKIDRATLRVVLSKDAGGWDHVSVSRKNRIPNWPEMDQIRRMFFEDHEAVMQYHAPLTEYVDGSKFGAPNCLHLWRPINASIPKPPRWMVGGMSPEEASKLAAADGF